ncbi:MAG: hypothetical protein ACFHWX_18875 [Bacteroidota bacterium]
MSSDRDMQSNFISWVKEKADKSHSFIDDLADLLNVSKDSAYRRVRGETLLTFNEISKISAHYKVSLDSFLNLSTSAVVFNNRQIGKDFTFKMYLSSIKEHLTLVSSANPRRMIWTAKDLPIMHYFQLPGLTGFKLFFWQKTILKETSFQTVDKYDPAVLDPEVVSISKSIWNLYCKIPSYEIWTDETIIITLRQIEYCYESNMLTRETTLALIDEYIELIRHIQNLATIGRKYSLGNEDYPDNGAFHLYYNEIAIFNNTMFFQIGEKQAVFLNYNMLNFMSTMDDDFCTNTDTYFQSIMQKSIPLSVTSEKERNKFFRNMQSKIQVMRDRVASSV